MTGPAIPEGEFGYSDAAKALGIGEDWLRTNIARLPHYKRSLSNRGNGRVSFTSEHLDEIRRTIFERRPAEPKRGAPVGRRRSV